ncbi:YaaL family protein [Leuconostoc pseudomesenteroides]|uniref:DUF2508 family protein n=1 Tax=Leuconostoc pseudomesenteroides TaxID=33968 RepID=A0A1X0VAW2_LEUPS|nr:YaaL family protein [Leuconostoc pseudomesenteroides]ORI96036.1 hypothetical protein BMR96_10720 [Leuconostoc pseudomesenteroides]
MIFGKKKTGLRKEYDRALVFQIDKAKIDWDTARNSEAALLDGQVNLRLIQAQTALALPKFTYSYLESRTRKTTRQLQTPSVKYDRP